MDAFGVAVAQIAERWIADAERLPRLAELTTAFAAALGKAGYATDAIRAALEPLDRLEAKDAKKKRPPPRRAGQLLRIPFGAGGARAIYGRILHAPTKGVPDVGLGICVVILDRDVAPDDVLDTVPSAKWLLGPTHPNDGMIVDGTWEVVGEVPIRDDEPLPVFRRGRTNPTTRAYETCLVASAVRSISSAPSARRVGSSVCVIR